MDFNVAYENGDGFLNNWHKCYDRLITFLSDNSNIKEKNIKASIDQLKTNDGIFSESKFSI